MSTTFQDFALPEPLIAALETRDLTKAFPIQASAIPPGLLGKDIQGSAPTGSGKTLAFGLPMLTRVGKASSRQPRALVLVPTRELAEQIKSDLAPLAIAVDRRISAVYGGVGYGPQLNALRRGVDVLVATPGRLEDLVERDDVDLASVDIVVIDEADRMADMGFLPAVRRIVDMTSMQRQTLLFSATLDGDVAVLGRRYQNHPVAIQADTVGEGKVDASHHFWRVARTDRPGRTARLINQSERTIVFTRTRHGADRLVRQLKREGVSSVSMHGGRSQNQRTRALKAFSNGDAIALVATDVAARGIHVEDVETVVHYDLAGDHKDYLHRSGRTARAGATGTVVTLVTDGQDGDVKKLLRKLGLRAPIEASRPEAVGSGAPRPSIDSSRGSASQRSIFVGNLPWKTTADELNALFSEFGIVERATISKQRRTGRSKGFGFVDIREHSPDAAIEALHGTSLGGRQLTVRPAR
jgi:superfamily II DNA/RNA helicase